jgi:predicted transcriptional regulator
VKWGISVGKQQTPRPTEAELAILRVLWDRGPSTVREIAEVLQSQRGTGYTTALKLLQIMTDKGLVARDETSRTHVYRPVVPARTTQRQLVSDLLKRAFHNSMPELVLQALSTKKASPEELAEIRQMIDEYERRGK